MNNITFEEYSLHNTPSSVTISETVLSRSLKFWILLIFQIPSVLCCIFVMFHMFTLQIYRQQLANHVILAMLIISFLSMTIDLSLTLKYLHEGIVKPQSTSFCFFWMYIDYALYTSEMLLTAWASLERHILIFASQYFRSTYQILFIHYLPILICLIYPMIFYMYTIFFYSCDTNTLDFHAILCGLPCFKQKSNILNWYDMLIHSVLPCILIVAFSIGLLIRFIRRKRRVQQQLFSWRKQRRMAIQLLSISCLYIIMNIPLFVIIFVQKCCLKSFAVVEYTLYLFYLYYFLVLCLPFVCLQSFGDIRKKLKRYLCFLTKFISQMRIMYN